MGKLDEAVHALQKLIAIRPNQAKPYFDMGNILKDKRKLSEALYFYKKAFLLNPNFIEACNNIGVILKDQNQLDEALIYYKKALSLNPSNAEIYNNIGVILRELNQINESLNYYEKALSLNFNLPGLHNNMGGSLKSLGRFQDAMESYKKAIELKPDYASAHRNLTTIKKYNHKDDQFNQMLDLYHNKKISEDQRCQINFALAKAFEDLENFEKAFTHYKEGNKIRKKLLNYDIHNDVVLFEKIEKTYNKIENKILKVNNFKNKINPIFIIGMPRSGTTLVEQIISSHSEVTGAGE